MFQSIKQNSINLAKQSTSLITWDSKNSHLVKDAVQNPESEATVKSLYTQLDVDKSGSLEEEEFRKLAVSFLKMNPKLADYGDADTLGCKLYRLTDMDKTGKVKYSTFHWLICHYDMLEQLLQEEAEDGQARQEDVKAKVTLLVAPPNAATITTSSSNLQVPKSVVLNLNAAQPLKRIAPFLCAHLTPTEASKDFFYWLHDKPLSANYSLAEHCAGTGETLDLRILPIPAYRKHLTAQSPADLYKSLTLPQADSLVDTTSTFGVSKSKAQKATFIIADSLLYIFTKGKEKDQNLLSKLFFLEYCKLTPAEDALKYFRYRD